MDILPIAVALLLVWLLRRYFHYFSVLYTLSRIPGVPFLKYHWLLGNMPCFLDRSYILYEVVPQLTETQHRIRRISVGLLRFPGIVLSHPDTVATILKTSTPKNMFNYGLLLPFIGDGLLLSSGKKWARDRRLLTHAFHFNILQEYTPLLHDSCQVLIDKLNKHINNPETQRQTVDFSSASCLLALDVMLRCIMGLESNCQLQDSDYTKGVQEATWLIINRAITILVFLPDFIYNLMKDGRRFRQICAEGHKFTSALIEKRRKELQLEGLLSEGAQNRDDLDRLIRKGHVNFLDILLTVRDEDGTGMNDSNIRDQVDTFLFEGHDTTASGMQWTLYFLAKHTDVQQRCREEAQDVSGTDGFVSHDNLSKLPYITQIIKESLRMCSPVAFIERELVKDTVVDGYTLPKTSMVSCDIFGLHHNPSIYPDPYKFDPERFSEENCRQRSAHAFIPFSAGPRNCIGQVLAMNELKLTV